MQDLHDILAILKHPGNPVDSFTRPSFSGPILLSTKSVSIGIIHTSSFLIPSDILHPATP